MYFDFIVFYHSLYVGFAYAILAFGASWYRQFIDEMELREIKLGEVIFTAYQPKAWFLICLFALIFSIFAMIALVQDEGNIFLYVVPVACAVNIIQVVVRARTQQLTVCTHGIVARNFFIEGNTAIEYGNISKVEAIEVVTWFKLEFYEAACEDKAIASTHISETNMHKVFKIIQQKNHRCAILTEHKQWQ